jgi:hypothetical protein
MKTAKFAIVIAMTILSMIGVVLPPHTVLLDTISVLLLCFWLFVSYHLFKGNI